MSEPRLIKKYANRRLYDTVASSHITLAGIRGLIVSGHDIKVVDDTSGEDITRTLLLQIIAEQEQAGRPIFDSKFLIRVIRMYGNPMQDLMGEFLFKSTDAFMKQQSQYQEQMQTAMAATPLAALQELANSNLNAWQSLQETVLGNKADAKKKPE